MADALIHKRMEMFRRLNFTRKMSTAPKIGKLLQKIESWLKYLSSDRFGGGVIWKLIVGISV